MFRKKRIHFDFFFWPFNKDLYTNTQKRTFLEDVFYLFYTVMFLFYHLHLNKRWMNKRERSRACLPDYWTSSLLGPMLWMSWEDSDAALYAWISRFLLRSPTPLPACSLGYGGVSAACLWPRPWASRSITCSSVSGENSWALGCSSLDTGLMETDGELKDTMMTETERFVNLHF